MTVKVNMNEPDPLLAVSYHDDAVDMVPGSIDWDEFFGHYPCLFKTGQEVGELQKNDFAKFLNGSTADIKSGSAGDVMIVFPLRGLNIMTENNIMTVSMTDNPNDPNFSYLAHTRGDVIKDKFYCGAYVGVSIDGKLRSLSGYTPTNSGPLCSQYRTLAQANGAGYDQLMFYPVNYLIAMYLLKYKNRNSQATIGKGYTKSTNTTPLNTGGTETKGMDWGEQTGTQHMKLFGMEDFWGNICQFVEGVVSDMSGNIFTATNGFSNDHQNYKNHGVVIQESMSGKISHVVGTTELGFIAKRFSSPSYIQYFCDDAYSSKGRIGTYGGSWTSGDGAGVFSLSLYETTTKTDRGTGARLMFL